jgi:hypothetical protein
LGELDYVAPVVDQSSTVLGDVDERYRSGSGVPQYPADSSPERRENYIASGRREISGISSEQYDINQSPYATVPSEHTFSPTQLAQQQEQISPQPQYIQNPVTREHHSYNQQVYAQLQRTFQTHQQQQQLEILQEQRTQQIVQSQQVGQSYEGQYVPSPGYMQQPYRGHLGHQGQQQVHHQSPQYGDSSTSVPYLQRTLGTQLPQNPRRRSTAASNQIPISSLGMPFTSRRENVLADEAGDDDDDDDDGEDSDEEDGEDEDDEELDFEPPEIEAPAFHHDDEGWQVIREPKKIKQFFKKGHVSCFIP